MPCISATIVAIGIDIGKNSFHVVGLDGRGAIAVGQKWSRGQLEARLANMPPLPTGTSTPPSDGEKGVNFPRSPGD
jgi:hypothetical protein